MITENDYRCKSGDSRQQTKRKYLLRVKNGGHITFSAPPWLEIRGTCPHCPPGPAAYDDDPKWERIAEADLSYYASAYNRMETNQPVQDLFISSKILRNIHLYSPREI